MSFKVITGRAAIAGSAGLRAQTLGNAGADLEAKLNADGVLDVEQLAVLKDEDEIQILAVVRVADVAPVEDKPVTDKSLTESAPVADAPVVEEPKPEVPVTDETTGGK